MARTPLFDRLQRSARLALSSERSGTPASEHVEEAWETWRISRREFLGVSAAAAGSLIIPGCAATRKKPASLETLPRIAVVGAGMAGLHCAWRLKQAGVGARIYEGSPRTGGRMLTARGKMAEGQLVELGGELIDTDHATMHQLAAELEVPLDDLFTGEPPDFIRDTFYVGGRIVSEMEIIEAFRPVAARMASDMATAEIDVKAYARLDSLSISEWLASVPESAGLMRDLLVPAFVGEFGLEAGDQSALNLLTMIDYEEVEPFRIFGDSDERFHVHGGNDTLVSRLAARLEGSIETGCRLVALRESSSGGIRLVFERGNSTFEADCDHAVLALPFTMLRQVEIGIELSPRKKQVIDELGYGTNAKLMGQFASRVWRDRHNRGGSALTDNGLQTLWDTSRGQEGRSGILTNFLGGEIGRTSDRGTPEERYRESLPLINVVFPGTAEAYREKSAVRMHWPTAPFVQGSYACYRPGQWALSGLEGERAGNVHFCGEHCSEDFQGYMEGACETGAKVAEVLLKEAGKAVAP